MIKPKNMIKKIYKLKTEDFKKPFKNIHNGVYFNIRAHNNSDNNLKNLDTSLNKLDNKLKQKSDQSSRYAVIINKKIDKRAVRRNSLKRQIFKILKDQETQNKEIQNPSLTKTKETKLYMINVKRMFSKENLEDIQKELLNTLL